MDPRTIFAAGTSNPGTPQKTMPNTQPQTQNENPCNSSSKGESSLPQETPRQGLADRTILNGSSSEGESSPLRKTPGGLTDAAIRGFVAGILPFFWGVIPSSPTEPQTECSTGTQTECSTGTRTECSVGTQYQPEMSTVGTQTESAEVLTNGRIETDLDQCISQTLNPATDCMIKLLQESTKNDSKLFYYLWNNYNFSKFENSFSEIVQELAYYGHVRLEYIIAITGRYKVRFTKRQKFRMTLSSCINGHISILDWMYDRDMMTPDQIDYHDLFDQVCHKGGSVEVFKWLVEKNLWSVEDFRRNDYEGFFKIISETANLELAKWYSRTSEITQKDIVAKFKDLHLYRNSSVAFLEWLIDEFKIPPEVYLMEGLTFENACDIGSLELAKWLHGKHSLTIDDVRRNDCEGLLGACATGYFEMVVWLCETFPVTEADVRSQNNFLWRTAERRRGHAIVSDYELAMTYLFHKFEFNCHFNNPRLMDCVNDRMGRTPLSKRESQSGSPSD